MKAKKTILTLLLAILTIGVWAQETADAKIIVWQKDGKTTEILFNQMPEFRYADGNVSVQNGGITLSWSLATLDKFTFEDIGTSVPLVPTGVKEVRNPMLDIVKGCDVYDLNGHLVKKLIRSLSELPKGTYILKDGSVTTKVMKK